MKKYTLAAVLIISTLFLAYFFYNNYQKNEKIKEDSSTLKFSDRHSSFVIRDNSNYDDNDGKKFLELIKNKKNATVKDFLESTEKKIVFSPINIDTLELIHESKGVYTYKSTLDLGIMDKNFNDFLVDKLSNELYKNNIKEITIFTLTPTEVGDVPLPPGVLTNVENNTGNVSN